MHQFDRCRVDVLLPAPLPEVESRNVLVSVNGRARNCGVSLGLATHSFVVEWGSVVFIRVLDVDSGRSKVHECDFLAMPEVDPFESQGIEIAFLNEPGMLNY
jgi:hypothetical protein